MRTRGRVQPTHAYVVVDVHGNLYIGVTSRPRCRANEHLRLNRHTVECRECPSAIDCEAGAIHFYEMQSYDGEPFLVLNRDKVIGRLEMEHRWPERA